MPAPIPEPGPEEEQSFGGAPTPDQEEAAQWWGGQGRAWVEGSADTGMPECPRLQHRRWKLRQERPGVFTWVTPAGRTYTTGPDTYPV